MKECGHRRQYSNLKDTWLIAKEPQVLEWKTFRIGHFLLLSKTFYPRVLEKDSVVESNKHCCVKK